MKKIFTSFLAASVVFLFSLCSKKETKLCDEKKTELETEPETKKETKINLATKQSIPQGTFKIGHVGSNTEYTKVLRDVLKTYTQDVVEKSDVGKNFFKLPQGLFLNSSDRYNSYIREDAEYISNWEELKTWLKKHVVFLDADEFEGGTDQWVYNKSKKLVWSKVKRYKNYKSWRFNTNSAVLGLVGDTQDKRANQKDFHRVLSDKVIKKTFEALETNTPTQEELKVALEIAGVKTGRTLDFNMITPTSNNINGTKMIYFNSGLKSSNNTTYKTSSKTWATLQEDFKEKVIKSLSDKTQLASNNIDALFVHVTNDIENKSDVYKSVVEKKEFNATKLFFIGEKSKSQSDNSSKVFAGENISTASFNKFAAAYIAGFQAAVGAIKFSGSENVYEETSVSFLIGSTSESTDKKKAFAFRRGVEAAADHRLYSNYLKVKFVSKTEDSSKSSKKLCREITEWKVKKDSKSKLYEFASSDTFLDADRRIIYIAGSTAEDWRGTAADHDADGKFAKGDDTGLIGALYNYKDLPDTATFHTDLTSKTYPNGVWIILDKIIGRVNKVSESIKSVEDCLNHQAAVTKDSKTLFERHEVKLYGSIGTEIEGTKSFANAALKGLYMGGPSYMIGKHTIFGAKLDVTWTIGVLYKPKKIWIKGNSIWSASAGNDTPDKAEDRFKNSFAYATENELKEAELIKASPWLK